MTACRPKRDERPSADEFSRRGIGAQIAEPEHRSQESKPPRVTPPELDRHGDALFDGEEPLLGDERLTPDSDLQRRVGAKISDPVGVLAPDGADDRFTGFGIVGQHHCDGVVPRPTGPTSVRHHEKGVTEKAAPSPSIQR